MLLPILKRPIFVSFFIAISTTICVLFSSALYICIASLALRVDGQIFVSVGDLDLFVVFISFRTWKGLSGGGYFSLRVYDSALAPVSGPLFLFCVFSLLCVYLVDSDPISPTDDGSGCILEYGKWGKSIIELSE